MTSRWPSVVSMPTRARLALQQRIGGDGGAVDDARRAAQQLGGVSPSAFARPARGRRARRRTDPPGVVAALAMIVLPPVAETTMSVNVPPTSMPIVKLHAAPDGGMCRHPCRCRAKAPLIMRSSECNDYAGRGDRCRTQSSCAWQKPGARVERHPGAPCRDTRRCDSCSRRAPSKTGREQSSHRLPDGVSVNASTVIAHAEPYSSDIGQGHHPSPSLDVRICEHGDGHACGHHAIPAYRRPQTPRDRDARDRPSRHRRRTARGCTLPDGTGTLISLLFSFRGAASGASSV